MDIKALIALPFNLPSLPRVMALLLFELERPELNLLRITQWVSSDPCLTARLMTVANAPYFQLSGQVRSPFGLHLAIAGWIFICLRHSPYAVL